MIARFIRIFSVALILALPAGILRAEDAALRAAVEDAGPLLLDLSGSVGMVLAVVRGNDSVVVGFGETRKGSGKKPDGRSIVRLGSISKVFTGHLLAALVDDGIVRLHDPLARYLPVTVKVPEFDKRRITLLDLATHSAGFPRDVDIEIDANAKSNPYVQITPESYYAALARTELKYAPGTVARYSNFGFGLLGYAIGRAAGSSYGALLAERVARPLGMSDTAVTLNDEQRGRLMAGYEGDKESTWDGSEIMQGSGGLFSTADDMVRWMRFNLSPQSGNGGAARTIAQAMYLSRQHFDAVIALDGQQLLDGIGLGWEYNFATAQRPLLLHKSGAFSGFAAYVVLAPGRNTGAFVAVNRLTDFPRLFGMITNLNNFMATLAPR